MKGKYYDETDDEFIEGEWRNREPREYSANDPGREGKTYGKTFSKKFVIRIGDPGGHSVFGSNRVKGHSGFGRYDGLADRGSFRFSDTEKRHLLIAGLALTAAFTIFLNGGFTSNMFSGDRLPIILSGALVAVITGFFTHELGHKFMAQRMGYWAEFRYSTTGLFMAIVVSFFGVLIAAPGAVYIRGRLTKRENGITSLAGPAINAFWATLFLGMTFLLGYLDVPDTGLGMKILWTVMAYGFIVNSIFAAFNLLPIKFLGLDGYKILAWNPLVYFIFCGVVVFYILMIFGFI